MARPREQHDAAEFVDAAFAIVEDRGIEACTIRAIGQHMDVDPSSVYRFFRSKDALFSAMFGRIVAQVVTVEGPPQGTPRQRIEQLMRILRQVIFAYPKVTWALVISLDAPVGRLPVTDWLVDALEDMGFTGEGLVRAYQLIESFTVGSSVFDSGCSPRHYEMRAARYQTIGPRPFRQAGESAELAERSSEEAYVMGIAAILDFLEAQLRS